MEKVLIIGAGPAGLSAGYYLAKLKVPVVLLEKDSQVGGLSKTVEYKGCRFDIGGHRFFSNNKEVEALWHGFLGKALVRRRRLSRIFYKGKFFDYPLRLSNAFENLGLINSFFIGISYLQSYCKKESEVRSFRDYIVKQFGKRLFEIFFKEYTEKIWGMPCEEISADWARQRITGLSFFTAIKNSLASGQDNNVRTLVKDFYYPMLGPGMMYDEMARAIAVRGGTIYLQRSVEHLSHDGARIIKVVAFDANRNLQAYPASSVISTMPLSELVRRLKPSVPDEVCKAAEQLQFRNILVVNLICANAAVFPDNWIYIHSPDIMLCRIQNYKNWSPLMVPEGRLTSLGLEYFCSATDKLWSMEDDSIIRLAQDELKQIGFSVDVIDAFVYRAAYAYPVYSLQYKEHIRVINEYLSRFTNLKLAGRSGRFRYDNMDAAMLSGISAARDL